MKVHIACKLAGTLKKMHVEGVVHGDLKEPNILMDYKGDPVICDFGSSALCDGTSSGPG